jgi:UDP-N-acetylmuramyl tripeptide synthase
MKLKDMTPWKRSVSKLMRRLNAQLRRKRLAAAFWESGFDRIGVTGTSGKSPIASQLHKEIDDLQVRISKLRNRHGCMHTP